MLALNRVLTSGDKLQPFPISPAWRAVLPGSAVQARDLCGSGRVTAYILRYEINQANGDFWQGLGRWPISKPPGQAQLGEAFSAIVQSASQRQGLDARWVDAVIRVESGYVAAARSPKGALGLMQVMPATAARYGVRDAASLFRPEVNVEIGTRYLRDLSQRYHGNRALILAAYNAGEGAVATYGNRMPPYPETRDYVRKVLTLYAPAFTQWVYEASLQF
jgi:soluble lytic murein transglycosylase-like protein